MHLKHPFLERILNFCEVRNEVLHVLTEMDPDLEMSHLHLEERRGKNRIIVYHRIKNCEYKAISNLFGDEERTLLWMYSDFEKLKLFSYYLSRPHVLARKPGVLAGLLKNLWCALPAKGNLKRAGFKEVRIQDLPLIRHWPDDGGAFITLPQVYSEDPVKPGIWNSNLGMYRIQLNGNDYTFNEEAGLHYQLHRGIGIHHGKAVQSGKPFKVSIFVGGPPAHTFSAVMPLPEGMPEVCMAGFLSRRRFRYDYLDGWLISLDADFVILGEVDLQKNKPEGPFGDHLGYYSLKHPFPYMRIHKVLAKPYGVWPFTVVGRPPQEDTVFGHLIHELTSDALIKELPGVHALHAVDAAGVHPLLLALGSERYTPYLSDSRPAELITQSLRILGTGQLSLAKFLMILEKYPGSPHPMEIRPFFKAFLERLDEEYSLHFLTRTSIDTLDYSGGELNRGSKLIMAATHKAQRNLESLAKPEGQVAFSEFNVYQPLDGVWLLEFPKFTSYENTHKEIELLRNKIKEIIGLPPVWIILSDKLPGTDLWNDFLWLTFTRCNPQTDIYAFDEKYKNKEWKFRLPLIFDARTKPHHAPVLKENENIIQKIKNLI